MNEIQHYIVGEHVEDFNDGLISRRELLRRVTLVTGSAAATLAVLASLGCNLERPTGGVAQPTTTAAATPAPTLEAFATPPPGPTTDGITVKPDDPRIRASRAEVKGPDGASLIGYLARPAADGRFPGILVVHENRGIVEHIKDVVRRVATARFVGLSVDLLSRQGGADRLTDGAAYGAELGKRTADDMVKDLAAGLDHLRAQSFVDGGKLGATGFCFGGGMVWSLVASGAQLRAAVPYYGPTPSKVDGLGTTKAAVLGVYAEQDTRVTAGMTAIEEQLKRAGTTYKFVIFPGVNHAFHNDTGQRYDAEQSRKAWVQTIEWFQRYLS